MYMPHYDIKLGDKVIYARIPEHSLNMFMKKVEKKYGERPVAQARMLI